MTRKAAYIYHDALSQHVLRDDHPLRPTRLRCTYELLDAYNAFDQESSIIAEPRPATEHEIASFHTHEYIEAVKSFSRGETKYNLARFNFSQAGDNPIFQGMYEAAALGTGASIVAAELVADGQVRVAFNTSGGLHHAASDHASGFCVFNDPVVAIKYLLSRGLRVAYVDVDAHHGDGVQNAFYDTNQVLTISLHESGMFLFPGTGFVQEMGVGEGVGHSVNLPLYPYTDDDTYLWAFREVVLPLLKAFKPDVLVTQLGIDSHCKDPLAHLLLTSWGYSEVIKEFAKLEWPWVALGGGGYDISAVARCWTIAYGIMLGKEWSDEIPQHYQEKYGLKRLYDSERPVLQDKLRQEVTQYAQRSVEMIRQLIFPIHKLA